MDKEECTRLWVSDSGMAWRCHPKNCVFCDNCTDIMYDSGGPYMVICAKDLPQDKGFMGSCEQFKEETPEVISPEEYSKLQQVFSKFYKEHKKEIDEIFKRYFDYLIDPFASTFEIKLGDHPNEK
jgi:hypothetical protein